MVGTLGYEAKDTETDMSKARYTCTFCGKPTVKRHSTGIWNCKACKKSIAGGAYTVA